MRCYGKLSDTLFTKEQLEAHDEKIRAEERERCAVAISSQGFYRDESGEKAAEIIRNLGSESMTQKLTG